MSLRWNIDKRLEDLREEVGGYEWGWGIFCRGDSGVRGLVVNDWRMFYGLNSEL